MTEQNDERPPFPEERGPSEDRPPPAGHEEQPRPDEDPGNQEALLDTGAPPGVYPNSEVPDPEVVAKAEAENDPDSALD